MAELKTIERDELKFMKLIKTPILLWQADPSDKSVIAFYKGGAIDDPKQVLAVGDVLEGLELPGAVMIGVMVTQRIGDLAIFSCAASSSINRSVMLTPAEPKPTFWQRLRNWYLATF